MQDNLCQYGAPVPRAMPARPHLSEAKHASTLLPSGLISGWNCVPKTFFPSYWNASYSHPSDTARVRNLASSVATLYEWDSKTETVPESSGLSSMVLEIGRAHV